MTEPQDRPKPVRYVEIDEKACNGCILCMKTCPTKAIRVKGGLVASIEGTCIACGECIRVCPQNAISPVTTEKGDFRESKYSIVAASSVVYAQFGEHVWPNDVLLALKKMGFTFVYDQAYTNEIFNVAMDLYINEQRKKEETRFPLISPICPVVVRLVEHRFPSLLKNIPPLLTPREIVSREAKVRLFNKYGWKPEEMSILKVAQCPALMIPIKEPFLKKKADIDGIIRLNSIYRQIKDNLQNPEEDIVRHMSGGVGLGWCMSGGEIAGLEADCIAVSGLGETVRYLEKIELGLLDDIDYAEFRVCPEGCLGGPFTVADKYRAKRYIQRIIRMFGVEKRVKFGYVKKLYDEGWFFLSEEGSTEREMLSKEARNRNIERRNKIERILEELPRKECGVCGCPDCRSFAEDVVDGKATMEECFFVMNKKKESSLKSIKACGHETSSGSA
jgi:Na+-translocating ferredoxin:NAD+ oxidoreductase RNF subunit RnfB